MEVFVLTEAVDGGVMGHGEPRQTLLTLHNVNAPYGGIGTPSGAFLTYEAAEEYRKTLSWPERLQVTKLPVHEIVPHHHNLLGRHA